jgi:hypothetical protein
MKGKKQIKRKQSEAKGIPKGKSRRLEGADERDRRIGAPATVETPKTLTYFAAHIAMASPSTTPSAPIAAEVVPVAEGTPAAVLPPLGSMASLYVGDLAETVDEPQLHALFSQVAPVATVRVCRDILSGVSLGYGYVNFYSRQEGEFLHACARL